MKASKMNRGGMTLLEVLVATIILVVAGIPVMMVLSQGRKAIFRVDARREIRYFADKILEHASRQPLHALFDAFGPGEVVGVSNAGRLRHRIAEYDPQTGKIEGENPLGFTREFLAEILNAGLVPRLHFEFYTREELGIRPRVPVRGVADRVHPDHGLLHMQAGFAWVDMYDLRNPDRRIGRWRRPMMCPAVVGRPGLKLASCPAIKADIRQRYLPILGLREGWGSGVEEEARPGSVSE